MSSSATTSSRGRIVQPEEDMPTIDVRSSSSTTDPVSVTNQSIIFHPQTIVPNNASLSQITIPESPYSLVPYDTEVVDSESSRQRRSRDQPEDHIVIPHGHDPSLFSSIRRRVNGSTTSPYSTVLSVSTEAQVASAYTLAFAQGYASAVSQIANPAIRPVLSAFINPQVSGVNSPLHNIPVPLSELPTNPLSPLRSSYRNSQLTAVSSPSSTPDKEKIIKQSLEKLDKKIHSQKKKSESKPWSVSAFDLLTPKSKGSTPQKVSSESKSSRLSKSYLYSSDLNPTRKMYLILSFHLAQLSQLQIKAFP